MGALFFVFRTPSLEDEPRFLNENEEASVEAAVPGQGVQRLIVTIMSEASELDEPRRDPERVDPPDRRRTRARWGAPVVASTGEVVGMERRLSE